MTRNSYLKFISFLAGKISFHIQTRNCYRCKGNK